MEASEIGGDGGAGDEIECGVCLEPRDEIVVGVVGDVLRLACPSE